MTREPVMDTQPPPSFEDPLFSTTPENVTDALQMTKRRVLPLALSAADV